MVIRIQNYNSQYRLHYYSLPSGVEHKVKQLRYIPRFIGANEYEPDVAEAIALNCAKKILEVFGQNDNVAVIDKELQATLQKLR